MRELHEPAQPHTLLARATRAHAECVCAGKNRPLDEGELEFFEQLEEQEQHKLKSIRDSEAEGLAKMHKLQQQAAVDAAEAAVTLGARAKPAVKRKTAVVAVKRSGGAAGGGGGADRVAAAGVGSAGVGSFGAAAAAGEVPPATGGLLAGYGGSSGFEESSDSDGDGGA